MKIIGLVHLVLRIGIEVVRYTTAELSSVRLDKNADVAVGEERDPISHSLGRRVSNKDGVHHGTSTTY